MDSSFVIDVSASKINMKCKRFYFFRPDTGDLEIKFFHELGMVKFSCNSTHYNNPPGFKENWKWKYGGNFDSANVHHSIVIMSVWIIKFLVILNFYFPAKSVLFWNI